MNQATDRFLTRRTALQSAVLFAACGIANAQTPPAQPKPKSRDFLWIASTDNQFLAGMVHRPPDPTTGKSPAVLILHDMVGSKVQPHQMPVALADALAGSGRTVLRVDLLGRGDSEGSSLDATPQRDLDDARHALAALQSLPGVDAGQTTVIGLSYGGALAAYLAGESIAIKRVILLASCPVDNQTLSPQLKEIDGKQVVDRLGNVLSKEFFDGCYELTPLTQLRKNRQNVLMIYGTHDADIRPDNYETARSELAFSDVNIKAITIAGADHTFASHDHEKQVIDAVVDWLVQG